MKLLHLLILFYASPTFALDAIKCSGDEFATLNLANDTAISYVIKAHEIMEANQDPLIATGFKKYFNVDYHSPNDQKYVQNVTGMMARIWSNVSRLKYRCGQNYRPYCQDGILALVPPLSRVQICPSYFNRPFEKQVGTLIHEWGHRWGSFRFGQFRLKYISEKYCTETAGAGPDVLTVQPDSYMLFTYYLATNGKGINCFKIID